MGTSVAKSKAAAAIAKKKKVLTNKNKKSAVGAKAKSLLKTSGAASSSSGKNAKVTSKTGSKVVSKAKSGLKKSKSSLAEQLRAERKKKTKYVPVTLSSAACAEVVECLKQPPLQQTTDDIAAYAGKFTIAELETMIEEKQQLMDKITAGREKVKPLQVLHLVRKNECEKIDAEYQADESANQTAEQSVVDGKKQLEEDKLALKKGRQTAREDERHANALERDAARAKARITQEGSTRNFFIFY